MNLTYQQKEYFVLVHLLKNYLKTEPSIHETCACLIKDLINTGDLKNELDILIFSTKFYSYFLNKKLCVSGKQKFINQLFEFLSTNWDDNKFHNLANSNRHFKLGAYNEIKYNILELYFQNSTPIEKRTNIINAWA